MNEVLRTFRFPSISNVNFLVLHLHFEGPMKHTRLHRALLAWRGIPYDRGRLTRYLNSCTLRNGGRGLLSTCPTDGRALFWRPRKGTLLNLTHAGQDRAETVLAKLSHTLMLQEGDLEGVIRLRKW